MSSPARMLAFPLGLLLLVSTADAQFGNEWVEFQPATGRILTASGTAATEVTGDVQEKDFAWGDLDQDGWTDLVIVRKQPATTTGAFPNFLLMNEGGILVDRSAQHASASDVAGDNGFLTPTNDRDVVIVDVDLDGWLDVVTAVALADAQPKHVSHPRVYVNQGNDASGNWLGLRFENARIPQMTPTPRFNEVAAGDVTGDGAADLYFTDSGLLGDRLLVNDGNGTFVDSGTTRMSVQMLDSDFGLATQISDLNGDGARDVVKASGVGGGTGSPMVVAASYNDPANVGHFAHYQPGVGSPAPYHVAVGDLNNDARPDIVCGDDGSDGYRYNLGNDAQGRVIWGPLKSYQFLPGSGGDEGFAGNILVADLDGDGWNDTIHADFDVDIPGCARRCRIYHNPSGADGSQITLLEEAQNAGATGWKGVKGMLVSDLTGTHDVAVFDLDNDGDQDIVIGRCSGTFVWLNQKESCPALHYVYGVGAPNSAGPGARIFSNDLASLSANDLALAATGAPANKTGLFLYGTQRLWSGVPFGNGERWIGGSIERLPVQSTDDNGNVTLEADFTTFPLNGLSAGDVRDFQFWYRDPAAGGALFNVSDALELTVCP